MGTIRLKNIKIYAFHGCLLEEEMELRSKLLEHVAKRIIDSIFLKVEMVTHVKVSVAKKNPPIGGDVAEVSVTMKRKR